MFLGSPNFNLYPTLVILSHAFLAVATVLPRDLSSSIPACASQCFISFIKVNYKPLLHNGSIPSLATLCSQESASGYTIGEGAFQCISAEASIGYCSPSDASERALYEAYTLCQGLQDAIEPTHKIITATMAIPTSGGIVTVPPVATTASPSASTLPTTLVLDTSSAPLVHTSSHTHSSSRSTTRTSHATDTVTSTTGTVHSTTSSTSTATNSNDIVHQPDKKSTETLSTGQVAGITVGTTVAILLVISVIFVIFRLRRKKMNNDVSEKGFFPIREPPGHSRNGGSSGDTSIDDYIRADDLFMPRMLTATSKQRDTPTVFPPDTSSPTPPPPPPPPKNYARRSYLQPFREQPHTSISPSYSPRTPQSSPKRPLSRLLPAKPILPLTLAEDSPPFDKSFEVYQAPVITATAPATSPRGKVPQTSPRPHENSFRSVDSDRPATTPKLKPSPLKIKIPNRAGEVEANSSKPARLSATAAVVRNGHASTTTEFEEDGTAVLSPAGQIWKPPNSAGPFSPIYQDDSSSGGETYYVSDKNGNWVLRHAPERPAADVSIVTPVNTGPQSAMSHTVYQSFEKLKGSLQKSQTMPTALPSDASNGASSHGTAEVPHTSGPPAHPRVTSIDSNITEFATSPETLEPPPPLVHAAQPPRTLSPVFESPRSVHLRDPADRSESSAHTKRQPPSSGPGPRPRGSSLRPPPSRPIIYSRPNQPRSAARSTSEPGTKQLSQAANVDPFIEPSPKQDFASPDASRKTPTMRIVRASPEPDDRLSLPSAIRHPARSSAATSQEYSPVQVRPYPGDNYNYPDSHRIPPQAHMRPRQQQQHIHQGRLPTHPPQANHRAAPPRRHPAPWLPHPNHRYPQQRTHPSPSSQQRDQTPHQQPSSSSPPWHPPTAARNTASPYQSNNSPLPTSMTNSHPRRPPLRPLQHTNQGAQFSSSSGTTFSSTSCSQNSSSSLPSIQANPSSPPYSLPPPTITTSSGQNSSRFVPTPNSLLAKRLGTDRAANMTLAAQKETGVRTGHAWVKETDQDAQQHGSSGATSKAKMTPTRRGSGLYLNVH